MTGEVFSRMDGLGFETAKAMARHTIAQAKEMGAENPLGQLDDWEASGLTMFRSMCTLMLRCTMVP